MGRGRGGASCPLYILLPSYGEGQVGPLGRGEVSSPTSSGPVYLPLLTVQRSWSGLTLYILAGTHRDMTMRGCYVRAHSWVTTDMSVWWFGSPLAHCIYPLVVLVSNHELSTRSHFKPVHNPSSSLLLIRLSEVINNSYRQSVFLLLLSPEVSLLYINFLHHCS